MEHPFQSYVFPLILVILAVIANAMVNFRLKFAPDAETAKWRLITLLQWPLNIGWFSWITYDIVTAPELTKIVAFQIALMVGLVVWFATVHVFGPCFAGEAMNRRTPKT